MLDALAYISVDVRLAFLELEEQLADLKIAIEGEEKEEEEADIPSGQATVSGQKQQKEEKNASSSQMPLQSTTPKQQSQFAKMIRRPSSKFWRVSKISSVPFYSDDQISVEQNKLSSNAVYIPVKSTVNVSTSPPSYTSPSSISL